MRSQLYKTFTAECVTKYRGAGQGGPGSCPHHARVPGHGTQEEEQLELASWWSCPAHHPAAAQLQLVTGTLGGGCGR